MDMSFDVGKVFQERLASSMGLDKYRYIMEQVGITNVAVDADFFKTEKECISEFDRVLPDYKGISKIKKIDSIFWSIR